MALVLSLTSLALAGDPGSANVSAAYPLYAVAGDAASTGTTATPISLTFPKDSFTVQTKSITTGTGVKQVTYRLYQHIPYVTNPVDVNFQGMDVMVPVKINGVDIDASNAPILFDVTVGGYRSVRNAGTPPPPTGPPAPPPGPIAPKVNMADYSLAAGYVVVVPGCRGWDSKAADGTFCGKAPAAIVDLKCAVKYIHYNKGVIPGNTDHIICDGTSASGALCTLLGVSGDSTLYASYFAQLGAANASDAVFASAPFCPVTDLEHADMAYEWMYGSYPLAAGLVDQTLSRQLQLGFVDYESSLGLRGPHWGSINANNLDDYILNAYLIPAAEKYLIHLSDTDRASYLAKNPWITWANSKALFTWADFVTHVGRLKGLPAFDSFAAVAPENKLFGTAAIDGRHFTNWSLQHATNNPTAQIDADVQGLLNLMNPMYFIATKQGKVAEYWWMRNGTSDPHTSLAVYVNVYLAVQGMGKNVNSLMYWDGIHGSNQDPDAMIQWMATITGYKK